MLAIGAFAYRWHQATQQWNELRRAANNFRAPHGWTALGRVQEGSQGCFISCDSPRVTLVYRTNDEFVVACTRLRVSVERQVGPATVTTSQLPTDSSAQVGPTTTSIAQTPEPEIWCPWRARAPGLGGRGYVVGGAGRLDATIGPRWTDKLRPSGSGIYAWIEFNSGLD